MELQEEVKALKAENDFLKQQLEAVNAEKLAFDHLFIGNLKTLLEAKKEAILFANQVNKKVGEINDLTNNLKDAKKQIEELSQPSACAEVSSWPSEGKAVEDSVEQAVAA